MFATVALAVVLSLRPGMAQGHSVLLRYKFHAGQTHSYRMKMAMKMGMNSTGKEAPMMNMDMVSSIKMLTKSVLPDGSGRLTVTTTPPKMTMNGSPSPIGGQTPATTMTCVISPLGKMSGANLSGAQSMPGMGMAMDPSSLQVSYVFPKEPVHVGSHWVSTVSMAQFGKIQMNNSVASISQSGSRGVEVKIHSSGVVDMGAMIKRMTQGKTNAQIPDMKGNLTMTMNYVFDVSQGLIRNMDMAAHYGVDMNMPSQKGANPGHMHMSGVMTGGMSLIQ